MANHNKWETTRETIQSVHDTNFVNNIHMRRTRRAAHNVGTRQQTAHAGDIASPGMAASLCVTASVCIAASLPATASSPVCAVSAQLLTGDGSVVRDEAIVTDDPTGDPAGSCVLPADTTGSRWVWESGDSGAMSISGKSKNCLGRAGRGPLLKNAGKDSLKSRAPDSPCSIPHAMRVHNSSVKLLNWAADTTML